MANLMYEEVDSIYGNIGAAGTSEVKSAVVDMQGWDELEYEICFGDNTSGSVVTIAAKENTANSTTSPSPTAITLLLGASAAALGTAAVITSGSLVVTCGATDTDSKIVKIAISHQAMTKQYQFVSVTPATQNAVINSIIIHRRRGRAESFTQFTSVVATAYAAA